LPDADENAQMMALMSDFTEAELKRIEESGFL
jgi:hypothetical protein